MIDFVIIVISIILIGILIKSIQKKITGQGCCSDCHRCCNCKKHVNERLH